MPQEDEGYVPKWASSLNQAPVLEDDADSTVNDNDNDSYSDLASVDDLPPFSDEESKGLHREIKLLEQRGEDAAKAARSHRERITVINDHLHSIRQEIDHTNSLVAAKKGVVETEEHISSLLKRELGQFTRDASGVDDLISVKQKQIARCKSQLVSVGDELEKLKTDLNWNQEELEQWATAATKKEEENLILQKYASADELKIKELALTIEDLTKVSVEKKSLLENEVTETRSNQTELEKLAERFKSRHDERRQLIQQWKDTIESMNNRDQAIGVLASQYSDLVKQEDEIKDVLVENKNDHEMLEVSLWVASEIVHLYSVHVCNNQSPTDRMNVKIISKKSAKRSVICKQDAKICRLCKNRRYLCGLKRNLFRENTPMRQHQ
jgi:chromosome segregation ATPase